LSEGWHEVEHDLRYKFKEDWDGADWASRAFNGVFAALETSEWTMLKILDDQSYYHYKMKNWKAMLRAKFRLRFSSQNLSSYIEEWLNNSPEDAKKLYRADRGQILSYIVSLGKVPLTLDNIIHVYNMKVIGNEEIMKAMPKYLERIVISRV